MPCCVVAGAPIPVQKMCMTYTLAPTSAPKSHSPQSATLCVRCKPAKDKCLAWEKRTDPPLLFGSIAFLTTTESNAGSLEETLAVVAKWINDPPNFSVAPRPKSSTATVHIPFSNWALLQHTWAVSRTLLQLTS
jgi:hypothetical protein